MIVSIWSAYLRRRGRILFLVALVLALPVQGAWAQKTVKAPAYEGTNATGPNFVADAISGPPLQVISTSQVNNFNADFLNGFHASAFAKLGTANTFTANQTINGTIAANALQVTSTALVNNLNANFLNGYQASAFAQTATANTFSADQTFTGHVTMSNPSNSNLGQGVPLHVILTASTCGCPPAIFEALNPGVDAVIDFHSAGREVGNIGTIFSDNNPRFAVAQNTSQIGVIPVTIAENGGNVGIGMASPTNILTVKQNGGNVIADGYDTYSSARWKTNIQTYPFALNAITKLRGVTYNRKSDGKPEVGLIAEEVASVIPEVVSFQEGSAQGVDYSRLTAVLIQAVKEQQEEITRLKARLDKIGSQK